VAVMLVNWAEFPINLLFDEIWRDNEPSVILGVLYPYIEEEACEGKRKSKCVADPLN
jgi:hypothetical protein